MEPAAARTDRQPSTEMNLSFSGCGFLGIYHIGVATCLREHAPSIVENGKVAGASAGGMVACCLITGCCLGRCTSFVLDVATKANSQRWLGPLHPRFDIMKILRRGLMEELPDNAHVIASGRLFLSLTRVRDHKNVLVSEFESKKDLVDALVCSAFVPFYCGLIPPKYKGSFYIDGGVTDNLPSFDQDTITVSPFSGESDICPSDNSSNFAVINLANTSLQLTAQNLYRLSIALFPPNAHKLSDLCKQGYDDTLRFLQKNDLISCKRHLSITTAIAPPRRDGTVMSASQEDEEEIQNIKEGCAECYDCKQKMQNALIGTLPAHVVEALQATLRSQNRGLLNYVRNGRLYWILSFLFSPYVVPADIFIVYCIRFIKWIPDLPSDLWTIYYELSHLIQSIYRYLLHRHHNYDAKLTYQFDLTEVDYSRLDKAVDDTGDLLPFQGEPIRNINMNIAMDYKSTTGGNSVTSVTQVNNMRHDVRSLDGLMQSEADISTLDSNIPLCHQVFDTFNQCLHVTNHMNAVIAYHYLDVESKQVMVEQIYSLDNVEVNFPDNEQFQDMDTSEEFTWDSFLDSHGESDSCTSSALT